VYAHLAANEEQRAVRSYVLGLLQDSSTTLVLTPLVLHEFVHVVTDRRRFDVPVGMAEAIELARVYLHRPNTDVAPVTERVMDRALHLVELHRLGRRKLADALIASALLEHGVTTLATCNVSDFPFDGLELVDARS
jgi:predicted nucleic acid-binding protein